MRARPASSMAPAPIARQMASTIQRWSNDQPAMRAKTWLRRVT